MIKLPWEQINFQTICFYATYQRINHHRIKYFRTICRRAIVIYWNFFPYWNFTKIINHRPRILWNQINNIYKIAEALIVNTVLMVSNWAWNWTYTQFKYREFHEKDNSKNINQQSNYNNFVIYYFIRINCFCRSRFSNG